MTPIPDDVIEAGARAGYEEMFGPHNKWEDDTSHQHDSMRAMARACLTAALQHAEVKHEGVLAKVPDSAVDNHSMGLWGDGWNAAIAAFRAGRMGDKG